MIGVIWARVEGLVATSVEMVAFAGFLAVLECSLVMYPGEVIIFLFSINLVQLQ